MMALKMVDLPLAVDADKRADRAGIELEGGVMHGRKAVGIGHAEVAHVNAGAERSPASVGAIWRSASCVHCRDPFAMVSTVTFRRSR